MDAKKEAERIVTEWMDLKQELRPLREKSLVELIEQSLIRIRQETIEECAKVAVNHEEDGCCLADLHHCCGEEIAQKIRELK